VDDRRLTMSISNPCLLVFCSKDEVYRVFFSEIYTLAFLREIPKLELDSLLHCGTPALCCYSDYFLPSLCVIQIMISLLFARFYVVSILSRFANSDISSFLFICAIMLICHVNISSIMLLQLAAFDLIKCCYLLTHTFRFFDSVSPPLQLGRSG